jgi:signal transduction histidine kinase
MPVRKAPTTAKQGSYTRRTAESDEVRREFARLLHDGVAQTLSAMLLELDELRVEQQGQGVVLTRVDGLERSTRKALSELRDLLRQLRAGRDGDRDLVKLVKRGIRARVRVRPAVKFELLVSPAWPERITGRTAAELHRIVEEAVENAIRHGRARQIGVGFAVSARARYAHVFVSDDGRGLPARSGLKSGGLGILGMRERAVLLGGKVQLAVGPGGRGTTVRVSVPIEALGRQVKSSASWGNASPRQAMPSAGAAPRPGAAPPPSRRRLRPQSGAMP